MMATLCLLAACENLPAQEPRLLKGHTEQVAEVRWSPDGKRLASASWDTETYPPKGTVKIWDPDKGEEIHALKGYSVSWSPDSKRLACSSDKTVNIWDADTWKEIGQIQGMGKVSWSPDGKRLASVLINKTITLWDADSRKEMATLRAR
jgi:WD40 repeat protein